MSIDSAFQNPTKRLGDLLVEQKIITSSELEEALAVQKENGGFLGKTLMDLDYVTEQVLITFLVKQFKIPHISLLDYEISSEVLESIPQEVCMAHNLLPIDRLGRILTIAMVDPLDAEALDKVRAHCPELRIKPILCSWNHFEIVSRNAYEGDGNTEDGSENSASGASMSMESLGFSTAEPAIKKAPVATPEPIAAAPVATPDDASHETTSPAARPKSGDSEAREVFSRLIEEQIGSAISGAVQNITDRLPEMLSNNDGQIGVDADELVEMLRGAISSAGDEAASGLLYKTQQVVEMVSTDGAALTAGEIHELLRTSMRQSISSALTDLLRNTYNNDS